MKRCIVLVSLKIRLLKDEKSAKISSNPYLPFTGVFDGTLKISILLKVMSFTFSNMTKGD